jgi:2-oxoglutarate ferredoxin oxidoreductase subunit gamma
MQQSFVFAGFGGQGVMFAGQLLAYAAMDHGFEVTWIPSYGPEMRGGTANCCVVVSDKPIGSPVVRQPGNAVVFNNPSFQKYEPLVAPEGLLVVNSFLVTLTSSRLDLRVLEIPATDIADELGDLKLANVVLLGALLSARPLLSLDALRQALEAHIPAHHRDKLPLNFSALDRGAQAVAPYLNRVPEGDGRQ